MKLARWLDDRNLPQLISLASAGTVIASLSLFIPDLLVTPSKPLLAMRTHVAFFPLLVSCLLLFIGGLMLLWRSTQALERGVRRNRWDKPELLPWRHLFYVTDWPIFIVFIIVVLWSHSRVFFVPLLLLRAHTRIMSSLKEPLTLPEGTWGRWNSMKRIVSENWGYRPRP